MRDRDNGGKAASEESGGSSSDDCGMAVAATEEEEEVEIEGAELGRGVGGPGSDGSNAGVCNRGVRVGDSGAGEFSSDGGPEDDVEEVEEG